MSAPAVNIFGWMRAVHGDADLTLADRLIASHLALYVDRQTGECFPSMQTLAEGVNVAVRSVQRAIGALEASGWLTRERTNRRTSYTYRLSTKAGLIQPEMEVDAPHPGPDMGVRSSVSGPDTGVVSTEVRPDTGVRRDRTRVSANLTSDPKKPPYPLSLCPKASEAKGQSGRVHVAVDDPRWAACATAYRRKRGVGPPTCTLMIDGRHVLGWSFDRAIVELPEIPASYRYPYAEAAE